MRMTDRVLVNRPMREVFDAITDLEKSPGWARSSGVIERRKVTNGPTGVGTQFAALDRIMGRRTRFVVQITEFEPPRQVSAAWTEPIGGGWTATCHETDGSTELVFTAETSPTGALGAIATVLGPVMKRAMHQDLVRFKAWVEDGEE